MTSLRFEGYFHQSGIRTYQMCPMAFYYRNLLRLDAGSVNMSALCGKAIHQAIEYAHFKGIWNANALFEVFEKAQAAEVDSVEERGLEIRGGYDPEKFHQMLVGYASKPWNRQAEVLAQEREFFFEISPFTASYQFAGRLDQVVKIPTHLLRDEFPRFRSIRKPHVIIHRDLKSGQRRQTSQFELALNRQIDIYAYALKFGLIGPYQPYDRDNGWKQALSNPIEEFKSWDLIPDAHALYFLQDHIPPKKPEGNYLKDEDGNYVPCDLLGPGEEPCKLGKRDTPCKGKREYCARNPLVKPAMYFTTRPVKRLNEVAEEVAKICASIRMNVYYRPDTTQLCYSYCQYSDVCRAEAMTSIEMAEAEAREDEESDAAS